MELRRSDELTQAVGGQKKKKCSERNMEFKRDSVREEIQFSPRVNSETENAAAAIQYYVMVPPLGRSDISR